MKGNSVNRAGRSVRLFIGTAVVAAAAASCTSYKGSREPPAPVEQKGDYTYYGTPGSPVTTASINGQQLPPPDPKFGGVIKDNVLQSKSWWPPRVVPPKGAPNVLLIMTDDVGFGAPSTF